MKRPDTPYDNISQAEEKSDYILSNCKIEKNGDEKRRRKRTLFIGVFQDIDDMLGIPSPLSPNKVLEMKKSSSNLNKQTFGIREVDASDVKVHESVGMRSQVTKLWL